MPVSLHPYFKTKPGQRNACHALLADFVRITSPDPDCLYYEFTADGDDLFCREAYSSGAAALAHLDSVGPLLADLLEKADLIRLEIHGPAAELEIMKPPLSSLNPQWFTTLCGISR